MTATNTLQRLSQLIQSRQGGDVQTSYVAKMLSKGEDALLKKIGEEATELVMAAKDGQSQKIVAECADLWFHSLMVLTHYGLCADDVLRELERREGMSGLEEKALRKLADKESHE